MIENQDPTLDEMLFFDSHPAALPLYEALKERILAEVPDARIEAKKTQISFFTRHMFAAASFTPVRKAKERPDPFLTMTFGLRRRVDSRRIDAVVEPYPNRWTHHVMIGSAEEADEELMGWIQEAAIAASAGNDHYREVTMPRKTVFEMKVSDVYPMLVQKAERKGRTKAEVDQVTAWLTGYDMVSADLDVTYADFFEHAPAMNPRASQIKGSVCGVKVEEIEDPLMQKIRWLDKLVDELAKGKPMDKILR